MANNNSDLRVGNHKGYKALIKILNKRVLAGFVAGGIMLTSTTACFKNDDSKDKLENDSTRVESVIDEEDVINNPDEEVKVVDSYMTYLNSIDKNSLSANTTSTLDNLMEKYDSYKNKLEEKYESSGMKDKVDNTKDKAKDKYESSGAKDYVQQQEREFLYSMNEIIGMAERKLDEKSSSDNIMPYEEYKEDYEKTENLRAKSEDSVKNVDKLFVRLEGFKGLPGGFIDKILEEYNGIKEQYDIKMSQPGLDDNDVSKFTRDYIKACEGLLDRINEWLEGKGYKPIPESGNLFEMFSLDEEEINQTSVKKLVKTNNN